MTRCCHERKTAVPCRSLRHPRRLGDSATPTGAHSAATRGSVSRGRYSIVTVGPSRGGRSPPMGGPGASPRTSPWPKLTPGGQRVMLIMAGGDRLGPGLDGPAFAPRGPGVFPWSPGGNRVAAICGGGRYGPWPLRGLLDDRAAQPATPPIPGVQAGYAGSEPLCPRREPAVADGEPDHRGPLPAPGALRAAHLRPAGAV